MAPITGLKSIVSSMAKAGKSSSDEAAFKLFKKMTSGYGTDLSPIVYKGKNLDELPDMIKGMLTGLKKPTVTVNGRSRVNGQGIFGFKIQDGNKTISTSALGVDLTKGEPIIQLRGTYGNGTQQAVRFNTVFDTNLTGTSALRGDVFVDQRLARQLGVSDDIIKELKGKHSSTEINDGIQSIRSFFGSKGNLVKSIDVCLPTLTQIASKTGKVTPESATEAFETITKAMGHQGKIKLNFMPKGSTTASGCFEALSGELHLNLDLIKNHQDLAVVLGHELTHMEDFIMLYKYLGADKFKRIFGIDKVTNLVKGTETVFNQKWYEQVSKFIPEKHFAFQSKGKITKIVSDGVEITDPKLIKEYLAARPKTRVFDIKTMVRELKAKEKMQSKKFSGQYEHLKDIDTYINSNVENHARETELQIARELKQAKVHRRTSESGRYGKAPGEYSEDFSRMFRKIESRLGKNKNKEFNELYAQSLQSIDLELGNLHSAINKFNLKIKRLDLKLGKCKSKDEFYKLKAEQDKLIDEVKKLTKKYTEITEKQFHSDEMLTLKVLERMQEKLGIIVRSDKDVYLEALKKVDPELGAIQEQLFKLTPKRDFQQLVKRQNALIKERYGEKIILNAKVGAQVREIRLQELNAGI